MRGGPAARSVPEPYEPSAPDAEGSAAASPAVAPVGRTRRCRAPAGTGVGAAEVSGLLGSAVLAGPPGDRIPVRAASVGAVRTSGVTGPPEWPPDGVRAVTLGEIRGAWR
ncbi:hypothetical protein [Streptomyces sp. NPDC058701]|uniref:hypothetical protein n=1 Tax=Streptomyces sp. NPDC058701 TaxID=3346608 RepID=UPI00364BFE77